ncbi:MAG: hypothetical protein JXB15_04075 [Anaerolineales bacterium]|nr:hypothetical protein [Anaerolineales bacterium]
MSPDGKLVLEFLNGPLDGERVTLQAAVDWSRLGTGPLACPWDKELGEPQGRFSHDERGWSLEALHSPHGTYRLNQKERLSGRTLLRMNDLLKASAVWLIVREC